MAKRDSDMTQGNIWRHLLSFSLPMMLGLLFQQLYNTVDTVVVGHFVGQQAQAAVGSTGPIINTIVGFCAGLATGASVVISQRYGAHDREALGKAVHTAIAVTFVMNLAGSLLFAAVEHALYGAFLFTIGWGAFFYEGTQAALATAGASL